MRCNHFSCNKKLGLIKMITNKCRCGRFFCDKHIFFRDHICTYDYKKDKIQLIKVVREKINKI